MKAIDFAFSCRPAIPYNAIMFASAAHYLAGVIFIISLLLYWNKAAILLWSQSEWEIPLCS